MNGLKMPLDTSYAESLGVTLQTEFDKVNKRFDINDGRLDGIDKKLDDLRELVKNNK